MGRSLGSSSQHDLMTVYISSGQCSGLSSLLPLLMKLITSLTGYSRQGKGKEVKCVTHAQLLTNKSITLPVNYHVLQTKPAQKSGQVTIL